MSNSHVTNMSGYRSLSSLREFYQKNRISKNEDSTPESSSSTPTPLQRPVAVTASPVLTSQVVAVSTPARKNSLDNPQNLQAQELLAKLGNASPPTSDPVDQDILPIPIPRLSSSYGSHTGSLDHPLPTPAKSTTTTLVGRTGSVSPPASLKKSRNTWWFAPTLSQNATPVPMERSQTEGILPPPATTEPTPINTTTIATTESAALVKDSPLLNPNDRALALTDTPPIARKRMPSTSEIMAMTETVNPSVTNKMGRWLSVSLQKQKAANAMTKATSFLKEEIPETPPTPAPTPAPPLDSAPNTDGATVDTSTANFAAAAAAAEKNEPGGRGWWFWSYSSNAPPPPPPVSSEATFTEANSSESPPTEPNPTPSTTPSTTQPETSTATPSVIANSGEAGTSQQPSRIWSWWYGSTTEANPVVSSTSSAGWQYFFSTRGQQQLINSGNPPQQRLIEYDTASAPTTSEPTNIATTPTSTSTTTVATTTETSTNKTAETREIYPNQVLPAFEPELLHRMKTQLEGHPTLIRKTIGALSSYFFHSAADMVGEQKSVTTVEPPDVRKFVIIGVHGWFPAKFVQKVIGEPTGTSEKFCELMEKAVRQHFQNHKMPLSADAVLTLPLQGEGKVTDRARVLYEQLLPPQDPLIQSMRRKMIQQAECVIIATHSQGTPVSTMLMNQLIKEDVVSAERQRLGLMAMAGISHGPFPFLKGNLIVKYFEAEAARELFDFMDPTSEVSRTYRAAMKVVLSAGVRVVAIASMADQVVPLYSATMHGFSHPSLLRAVYIDGHDYEPNFLTGLIAFILRLRNHGIPDHGLAVHLSEAVAGSLYSGTQGHSTIYEEISVYNHAVRWILGAPRIKRLPHPTEPTLSETFRADARLNPYYLPWILRGMLENEQLVNTQQLQEEVEALRAKFDEWSPTGKIMKDLKLRLEPIRARL